MLSAAVPSLELGFNPRTKWRVVLSGQMMNNPPHRTTIAAAGHIQRFARRLLTSIIGLI